jgi:hypothetical protein
MKRWAQGQHGRGSRKLPSRVVPLVLSSRVHKDGRLEADGNWQLPLIPRVTKTAPVFQTRHTARAAIVSTVPHIRMSASQLVFIRLPPHRDSGGNRRSLHMCYTNSSPLIGLT